MSSAPGPKKGRGASTNPKNRFYERSLEPDPEAYDPEEPLPRTQFLKDTSRSIIATNDSPDVGFEASINPYRGCEHGCVYCLSGETPILMGDGTPRPLSDVRAGDWIYGTRRSGGCRRYVKTQVVARWKTRKPAFRISLEDGRQLIASGDHRFLTERGWKYVTGDERGRRRRPHLTPGNKLIGIGKFGRGSADSTSEYRRGYLSGLFRGDGHYATHLRGPQGRSNGNQFQFRLATADAEALRRAGEYLEHFGVVSYAFDFSEAVGGCRPLSAIRAPSPGSVSRIEQIVSLRNEPPADWSRGFLAGIFDAGGSHREGCIRIAITDSGIIFRTQGCLKQFGFRFATDDRGKANRLRHVRLLGGLSETLRFFHTVRPVISRKREFEGTAVKSSERLGVVSIESLGREEDLFDITTGTGDFVANGVISHNCYARPFHEFLGFSAGLDFETKILVKEDAPELLRKELSSRKWRPKTLAVSGVTDAYQPVERKLGLTRRCLEVLAEFRNPAVVITKNHLVTRDADLLAALAAHRAACAVLSITTLDPELARTMEPRTSSPARRLEAIARLAEAGVPVGVNVAPVIPGLTDHEIPEILAAAAGAGATFAGHIIVRLPHAVKELFEKWLADHFPGRKEKVLRRIREVRGGALNDPRFGSRMEGSGVYADQIHALFRLGCKKAGLAENSPDLSAAAFRVPPGPQLTLFE